MADQNAADVAAHTNGSPNEKVDMYSLTIQSKDGTPVRPVDKRPDSVRRSQRRRWHSLAGLCAD